MKTIKLLAALALPAMFAACTSEEVVNDNIPQKMQDVVGAELVGADISINMEREGNLDSRLTSTEWQTGDELGLAWVVKTDATTKQNVADSTGQKELMANHLFVKPEGASFNTKGNVYKGWHFAYWPFEYMEQPSQKIININPNQTKAWSNDEGDRFDNAFYISARHFLSADDLDENYQLDGKKTFELVRTVDEIVVVATPTGGFVTNEVLNALKVKSVQLDAKAKVFSSTATLYPNYLPTAKTLKGKTMYKKNGDVYEYDKDATVAAVKKNLYKWDENVNPALTPTFTQTIMTDVSKAGYLTGGSSYLRVFTTPSLTSVEIKNNPVITIEVECGKFTIDYTKNAEEGSAADINNKAIEALIAAYSENGYTKANGNVVKLSELTLEPLGLNVALTEADFEPNFENITSYDEWKKAVDLVDALGTYNETEIPEFTIKGDILVNESAIYMPKTSPLKVKAFNDEFEIITTVAMTTWPSNLQSENVNVVFDSNVTLSDASLVKANSITVNAGKKLTLKSGKTATNVLDNDITNNGTIVVQKNAGVMTVTNNTRIEVVYGSYVTTNETKGTVAYVLTGNDKAYQINYLIADNNTQGNASVNTLVVNSGKTLNLGLTDPAGTGLDDPYNPTTGADAIPLADLSNINVEMNGGSIVGVHGRKQSVGAVSVLKGTNTITDVIPASIEIAAKATLNIDATKDVNGVKYPLDMPATQIDNAGTLNVETNTHVDVLINTGTVDATGYKLHSYTESNTQAGKTIGDVKLCDETPEVDMSQYGSAIKDALDTFNAANNNALSTYDALVNKLNAIAADVEAAAKWSSLSIYEAIVAYYEAAELEVPTTFTALTIAKIEGATGVDFGLQ